MYEKISLFNTLTMNEEVEENFNKFFSIHKLLALFTNDYMSGEIKVTDSDMRAVINPNGAYHNDLVKLSNLLSIAMDNKAYEDALFRVIYTPRSFQKFMKIVRNINNDFEHYILDKHKHNFWNIVFYSERIF